MPLPNPTSLNMPEKHLPLQPALSQLLPSMDPHEPEAEDEDENPFGDDDNMKDESKGW